MHQISTEEYKTRLEGQSDPLGDVQEIKIWPCKWYMHNPAAVLENDSNKLLWDFDLQTDHLI